MKDRFNLRRNVVTSVVAFATNLVLLFVTYRLIITGGGLQTLGIWTALMSWISLVRLGDLGIASAVVRFVSQCDSAQDPRRIRSYLDTALAANAFLFVTLAALGYALYAAHLEWIVSGTEADVAMASAALPLVFAGFVLSTLSALVLGGLTGIHRGYQSALISIAGAATQLAVAVVLVPDSGLVGLAAALVCQHAAMVAIGWALVLRALRQDSGCHGGPLPMHVSGHALREMLRFSVKVQFAHLVNGLFEPLSKILVGRSAGLELLGLYELAYRVIALPRNALVAGAHATVPTMIRLIHDDLVEARKLHHTTRRRLLKLGTLALAAAVLGTPFASWIWLGRTDERLWWFVAILACGFMLNIVGAAAYLLGEARGHMRGNIFSSVAALLALVVLIPLVAPSGAPVLVIAAIATSIGLGGVLVQRLNRSLIGPSGPG